jgi:RND family efflux transporter MFP subunit
MKTSILLRNIFCILLCLCALAVFSSCKREEVKTELKLVNVQTQAVEQKRLQSFLQAIGTLNANEEVVVSAEVDGVIKNVSVDEGSIVSKGIVIASIDDIDYGLELRRSKAALGQAEATLANTRLEYNRKDALQKEELVTKQQYEDVQTRLALAEADVERAKAALALAEQKFTRTKVRSPLSGSVKEKRISAGDYVKNGNPLFVLIQSNPLKLDFTVPERNIGALRKGQEVTLTVDAYPDREFKGKIDILYPNIDDRTRTLKIEALVPNGDSLLKAGLFAKVVAYTSAPRETVLVPITALLYEADKVKVFVIEGDTAKERQLKTGAKYGEMMEVLQGVRAGENVVVVGQQTLSDGTRVRILQPASQGQDSPVKE